MVGDVKCCCCSFNFDYNNVSQCFVTVFLYEIIRVLNPFFFVKGWL